MLASAPSFTYKESIPHRVPVVVVLLDIADHFLIQARDNMRSCLINPQVQEAFDISSEVELVIEIDLLKFRQVP